MLKGNRKPGGEDAVCVVLIFDSLRQIAIYLVLGFRLGQKENAKRD